LTGLGSIQQDDGYNISRINWSHLHQYFFLSKQTFMHGILSAKSVLKFYFYFEEADWFKLIFIWIFSHAPCTKELLRFLL